MLLPGLYETWIICEYCDQKTLQDAIAGGRIRQQGNPRQPDLVSEGCPWQLSGNPDRVRLALLAVPVAMLCQSGCPVEPELVALNHVG